MGNQWGRGGTGFPRASFNSFGGPQAPFGGDPRVPALPAASPRGSPGSLAGGDADVLGRPCKGRSRRRALVQVRRHVGLQGRGTSARGCERAAVQALPCKHTSVWPSKPRVCERAVPPTAQRPLVRRAHMQLCKSEREHRSVLLARLQLRASTHAHTRACLQLCKCAGVSFPTPKCTDGCTTVVSGMETRGATSSPRCRLHPALPRRAEHRHTHHTHGAANRFCWAAKVLRSTKGGREGGKRKGFSRDLEGPQRAVPVLWHRGGVEAPLVAPRGSRGADFWAETATF